MFCSETKCKDLVTVCEENASMKNVRLPLVKVRFSLSMEITRDYTGVFVSKKSF